MTVKESDDVAGLPTPWGLTDFAGVPVGADSVAVARRVATVC
jgi:amidase